MTRISARLRYALGSRTITWLSRELGKRGVPGAKYSNVHKYVSGSSGQATTLWLAHAANVLGVSPGWLTFGDGPEPEHLDRRRHDA